MKKFSLLIMCLVLIAGCAAGLSSCSKQMEKEVSTTETESSIGGEITEKNEVEIEKTYSITEVLSDFNGGRAWVSYSESDNDYADHYAMIDTNGYIVWSVAREDLLGFEFVGGMSTEDNTFCLFEDNNANPFSYEPGMIILDSLGNIKFDSRDAEDGVTYYYLGYGDGTYFAVKHIANFNENEYFLSTFNTNGEIINNINWPESWNKDGITQPNDKIKQTVVSWGNGIFQLEQLISSFSRDVWFYETTNNTFFLSSDKFLEDDKNIGFCIVDNLDGNKLLLRKCLRDLTGQQLYDYYYITDVETFKKSGVLNVTGSTIYQKGIINQNDKVVFVRTEKEETPGVYDYKGNLLTPFPENWNIKGVNVSDKYIALLLNGEDGKTYVSLLDKKGNIQYEPKMVDNDSFLGSFSGYVSAAVDGEDVILNSKGEITDRKELDKKYKTYTLANWNVVNGFEKIYNENTEKYDSYRDAEGNVLDTIYQVVEYKEGLPKPDFGTDVTFEEEKQH